MIDPHPRAGSRRKNLSGEALFHSFVPSDVDTLSIDYNNALINQMRATARSLEKLHCVLKIFDEVTLNELVDMLRQKEAEASWKLSAGRIPFEGTQNEEKPLDTWDLGEIADLRKALDYAADPFDDLPISRRLLSNAHYLLAQSPRYDKKYRGEFRQSPVWMGTEQATLASAPFVAPVDEDFDRAFTQLEGYIHGDAEIPALIKITLAHYQFEVIHPFIDGNGRAGRIFTQLMLAEWTGMSAGVVQLSDALLHDANEYYSRIEFVEFQGDYENWIRFFLSKIENGALKAIELIQVYAS